MCVGYALTDHLTRLGEALGMTAVPLTPTVQAAEQAWLQQSRMPPQVMLTEAGGHEAQDMHGSGVTIEEENNTDQHRFRSTSAE